MILSHYFFNGSWSENGRIIYTKFNATYPHEVVQFQASFATSVDVSKSLIFGSIGGIIIAILTWLAITWCDNRTNEELAALYSLSIYYGVFVAISIIANPGLVFCYVDIIYMSLSGLTLALSSFLYVKRRRKCVEKEKMVSNFRSSRKMESKFLLKKLELEYNGWRDIVQSLIGVCAVISSGIFCANLFNWWRSLPLEIFYSNEFFKIMFGATFYLFTLVLGLSIGVIIQMLIIRNSILEIIEELGR